MTMAAAAATIVSMFDVTMKIEVKIHNVMNHYATTTTAVNHNDYFLVVPLNADQVDRQNKHRKMTAWVVHVHNDQTLALVALVDGNNHRDYTDRQVHRVRMGRRSPSVVVEVAFVDVRTVNHRDEIVRSYNHYAYSDTIDQDRRRRRRYFD